MRHRAKIKAFLKKEFKLCHEQHNTMHGCSKCRYATRGCSRCNHEFRRKYPIQSQFTPQKASGSRARKRDLLPLIENFVNNRLNESNTHQVQLYEQDNSNQERQVELNEVDISTQHTQLQLNKQDESTQQEQLLPGNDLSVASKLLILELEGKVKVLEKLLCDTRHASLVKRIMDEGGPCFNAGEDGTDPWVCWIPKHSKFSQGFIRVPTAEGVLPYDLPGPPPDLTIRAGHFVTFLKENNEKLGEVLDVVVDPTDGSFWLHIQHYRTHDDFNVNILPADVTKQDVFYTNIKDLVPLVHITGEVSVNFNREIFQHYENKMGSSCRRRICQYQVSGGRNSHNFNPYIPTSDEKPLRDAQSYWWDHKSLALPSNCLQPSVTSIQELTWWLITSKVHGRLLENEVSHEASINIDITVHEFAIALEVLAPDNSVEADRNNLIIKLPVASLVSTLFRSWPVSGEVGVCEKIVNNKFELDDENPKAEKFVVRGDVIFTLHHLKPMPTLTVMFSYEHLMCQKVGPENFVYAVKPWSYVLRKKPGPKVRKKK